MDGVWSVSGNISTGSLVIFYDRTAVGQNDIVNRGKKLFEIPGEDISGKHNPRPAARTSRSLIPSLGRFLELTMLVGAVFVWEMILKRPVSQGFFSPLGAMTSLAAWPLLRKGWKRLQARELTLESFLGGGVFLAVVMGQAKAALEILWINSAGELLQDWVSERSRVAIQEILELTEKETSLLAEELRSEFL
jgi:cation-transporting P-type ATPase C